MKPLRRRWELRNRDVVELSDDGEARIICRLNIDNADWASLAACVAAVPELLDALDAAAKALEKTAPLLTRDSEADLAAARALGLMYQVMQRCGGAFVKPEEGA